MATPTESVQEQHKAWLERMTTVLGEFCANSKSIAWMLELMQRQDAVDSETTRAIREGLAQNLEEGAEVEKHRQFIQSAFPERQQRASVVSNHLQNDIPGLQAVLERMGFVVAAAMTAANEQQTANLAWMVTPTESSRASPTWLRALRICKENKPFRRVSVALTAMPLQHQHRPLSKVQLGAPRACPLPNTT
jgi:hypothetical protein